MNTLNAKHNAFENTPIDVKLKLAALWTSFMFLYIYVDYFHLFMPHTIEDMMAGQVFTFEINTTFLLVGLISVSIPALMIALSILLPAKANRLTNIILATLYIPYSLFNLAGEAWIHMIYGAALEVILLCVIIRLAWKWPRTTA